MPPNPVVGRTEPPVQVTVERGRLQLFAKATGQVDPLYTDVAVAQAHGHPDLPVPPTFLFGLDLERPDPFDWVRALGRDMATALHGEQSFEYRAMAYAGDTLTARSTITGVTSKKGGALEVVDRRTEVTRHGGVVAVLHQTVLFPAAAAS